MVRQCTCSQGYPLSCRYGVLFNQHHVPWGFWPRLRKDSPPFRLSTVYGNLCMYVLFTSTPLFLSIADHFLSSLPLSIILDFVHTYNLFTSPSPPATSTTTPMQNPIIGSLHACGDHRRPSRHSGNIESWQVHMYAGTSHHVGARASLLQCIASSSRPYQYHSRLQRVLRLC
jgi:hypothetical protein